MFNDVIMSRFNKIMIFRPRKQLIGFQALHIPPVAPALQVPLMLTLVFNACFHIFPEGNFYIHFLKSLSATRPLGQE